MKEEKVIKSLKITSIAFGLILGILSVFLVLNESFALFTSKTAKTTYSLEVHKIPMLTTGRSFQTILRNAGYKDKITEVVFEANKDLNTIATSIDSFDVSAKYNGAIMGYMTEDQSISDMYILHIATDSDKIYANSDSSILFCGLSTNNYVFLGLKSINGIEMLDTSKVTDMNNMFAGCANLESLDVAHFDTSDVVSMTNMFNGCSSLTSLDVTHFDTTNVIRMACMFCMCSGLTELDVTNFNTSKVINMQGMFWKCSGLTELDVTNFNTSNVTNMSSMFRECSGLTILDLSGFDTSNVKGSNTSNLDGCRYMFYGCSSLTELRMDSAEIGQVGNYLSMFTSSNLHIYLKDTQTNRDFMSTNFSAYTNITWV